MAARNQVGKNQTKDLKYATHLLSEKFRNMSKEKKMIVRDLGFGGLMHIPPLRSETQEDSEDSPRKEPSKKGKKMESKKRKKNQENSDSESESTDESEQSSPVKKQKTKKKTQRTPKKTQSKKKKVVVEDSSPEQAQSYHGYSTLEKEADLQSMEGHYVSSETIPDVNLGSDDHSSQGHTEQSSINKPAESMLSLVEESASEPADSNMMVMREETPSEGLAIVPIQVCLPVSQRTTVPEFEETPETEYEPTPLLQIEGTTKTFFYVMINFMCRAALLNPPPNNLKKAHPHFLQLHLKCNNPAPEDAAALMMMARIVSYVPKKDLIPSFILGFTDSSQEETTTQEGASTQDEHMTKTPETPKLLEQLEDLVYKIASGGESGAESFEKFETPVRPNLNTIDMKQKCYHWAIQVKTYADGLTDEFDNICKLQAQDIYTLSKFYLASLVPKTHIEVEIVYAMCFIVNQQNIQRFQEENMALANHLEGVFLQPKNNKPFRVEDYPMFIPFLDLQKLKSHRYIFTPVCHSFHWWLWIADTRKRKFYIVNPLHNKSPSKERTVLNTFVGYVISRIKVYAGGAPLKSKDKDREIVAPYLHISGQKTSYDCAIYVMKWLEIFEPANIKRWKYEWDDWTQDEVDHFRVEYASWILFHDMNLDKDEAIRGSNAIRLSKPSSLLLSPYCQIDSQDVDTA
ncbi:uncharacterized protein DS421_17g586870 [Arachis hypogaea]|nr:uncharacterized protein DS421_17g586870 [Arachis hypogaea]